MALVPYRRANSLLDELARDLGKTFSRGLLDPFENGPLAAKELASWSPAVDIVEEENRYLIKADIPGVEPKDIEVTFDGGVLTVRGERKSEDTEENKGFKRVERTYGSFYRQFSLPDSVDANQITAKGNHGVLEITVPKAERSKPKRIEIRP